jgi:vancomycin resistance protein VanJ
MTGKVTTKGSGLSNQKNKSVLGWLPKLLLAISFFLWFVVSPIYIYQPDFCAALTFWPVWLWAILGIVSSFVAMGVNKKARLVIILAWVAYLTISEGTQSFLRGIFLNRECKSVCVGGNCLRVISLNCAGGNIKAAEEISQYSPDIVLFQESPSAKELEILKKKLFAKDGEFVIDGDMAILASGHVMKTEVTQNNRSFMTEVRVNLSSGFEIESISVHLPPPPTSINLLSPDCWREHYEDRKLRLQQIVAINEQLKYIADNIPIVVGGDFNAKPWTGASKILSLRLYDTFKRGGFGWPGTAPAHLPLWRIDQIRASRHFKTVKVQNVICKQSDHRMVICDLCKL